MGNNKAVGFTLSEALIAISIVGIVSALTVPAIVKSYQKHANLLSLQKVYTELQQNLEVFKTENYRNRGVYGSRLHLQTGYTIDTTTGAFLTEYYKINTDCGTTAQPCFASTYIAINDSTETAFSCDSGYSVLLPSGAAICMIPATKSIKHMSGGSGGHGYNKEIKKPVTVYVDTNGSNQPNIGGRDMFKFNIYEDYSIDVVSPDEVKNGVAEENRNTLYTESCLTSSFGEGCFGKILNDNWKMNY